MKVEVAVVLRVAWSADEFSDLFVGRVEAVMLAERVFRDEILAAVQPSITPGTSFTFHLNQLSPSGHLTIAEPLREEEEIQHDVEAAICRASVKVREQLAAADRARKAKQVAKVITLEEFESIIDDLNEVDSSRFHEDHADFIGDMDDACRKRKPITIKQVRYLRSLHRKYCL